MTLLSCPGCGYSKELPADRLPAGRATARCPKCRTIFPFPPEPDGTSGPVSESASLTRVACPHCRHEKSLPTSQVSVGRHRLRCWQCGETFEYLHQAAPEPGREGVSGGGGRPLPPVIELFSRSWQLYKERIWTLLGIYLATMVAPVMLGALLGALAVASLAGGGEPGLGSGLLALLFGLLMAGLMTWGMAAMLVASVDATTDIKQALIRGGRHFWSFGWLMFLLSFLVVGGLFLLVLPGLVFMAWFLFAQYLLVDEDERGMRALLKSREYVRGYFWPVLLRLLVLWVSVWFLSMLLGWIPLLGGLLQLLLFPFTLLYQYLVLEDIRQARIEPPRFTCTTREKLLWIGVAVLGYLVLPIAIWLAEVPERFNGPFQDRQQPPQGIRLESPVVGMGAASTWLSPEPAAPVDGLRPTSTGQTQAHLARILLDQPDPGTLA